MSVVVVWLLEAHVVRSVDGEVGAVDVVTLHNHLENFWLMHNSLLHEVNDFVLDCDGVVHIMVKLHLQFVLKLSILLQELFVVNWFSEVLIIFGEQVHFTVCDPRVELVSHWVLSPYAAVLASLQQKESVDFLIKVLPV